MHFVFCCYNRIQGKPPKDAEYDDSTDEESSDKENSTDAGSKNNGIPELPDFFNGKNFFIYGGKRMDKEENRQVKRFIIAFGG